MTEIWYSPCASVVVRAVVMHVEKEDVSGRKIVPRVEEFGDGQSVSSCLTCQVQLTPMLCGNADATCP
jgi:hypothetical protein